jgi:ankyrin repeat protein
LEEKEEEKKIAPTCAELVAFFKDCKDGQIQPVFQMLKSRSIHSEVFIHAFELSVRNNKSKLVQALLTHDIDFSSSFNIHMTVAVTNGFFEIVKLLVQHQKTLDPTDGFKLVQIACNKGHVDIMNFLLSDKTVFAVCHSSLFDLLMCCCESGNLVGVKALMPHLTLTTNRIIRFLGAASGENRFLIVKFLLQHPLVDKEDYKIASIFEKSCAKGHLQVVQEFTAAGYNGLNFGFSKACRNNRLAVAKFLLEFPSVVSSLSRDGWDFLTACSNGFLDIVNLFLEHPSIDIPSQALARSFIFGQSIIFERLLQDKRVTPHNDKSSIHSHMFDFLREDSPLFHQKCVQMSILLLRHGPINPKVETRIQNALLAGKYTNQPTILPLLLSVVKFRKFVELETKNNNHLVVYKPIFDKLDQVYQIYFTSVNSFLCITDHTNLVLDYLLCHFIPLDLLSS